MFRTIVVGVDAREGGRDALALAARLPLGPDGGIVVLRVVPYDFYVSRAGPPPYLSAAERSAEEQLASVLAETRVRARTRVMGAPSPARALHRAAEDEGADLVVVGSSHHSRLGRVLVGDDAVATLHGSPCPVAVAPRGLAAADRPGIRRIGVGFDGSPEARQAVAFATALAAAAGAAVTVRAVVATPPHELGFPAFDSRDWLQRAEEAAGNELRGLLGAAGDDLSGDVVVGTPVEQLTALSREVDALVLGSRAWGPVRRLLLGSTAAAVVREAHCPVFVLPRGAATGAPGEHDLAGADRGADQAA